MNNPEPVSDRTQRLVAETTFDKNVVVVAGAGTGKTTLLVNRLVHLLVKEPDPVPVTHLVALTFTNKAAAEMKARLRDRLRTMIDLARNKEGHVEGGAVTAAELCSRYNLTEATLAARGHAALHDLEKAQIGTLHSFAAHLLRLHPLESGLDSTFQEDDGSRFDEVFSQAWDLWMARELSRDGFNHDTWRTLLGHASLEDIRSFALSLCNELMDLDALRRQLDSEGAPMISGPDRLAGPLLQRLIDLHDRGRTLLASHARAKPRKIERLLDVAVGLLASVLERGTDGVDALDEDARNLLKNGHAWKVAGWDDSEFESAKITISFAKSIQCVDSHYFNLLLRLLLPLVTEVRATFAARGLVSFDGLLARARSLLWDHPTVRERLKREYRAVLVDEFQDTDPLQYEIILALSERMGSHATHWRETVQEPGKLCIVGDPKQSIYAFRRADIEAFDRVVEKIQHEGGLTVTLTSNFRSGRNVLVPVNAIFDQVFIPKTHVQPPNVRLEARSTRSPASCVSGVGIRLVRGNTDEEFDTDAGTRAEAENLAQWLKESLLLCPGIQAGHVAILFRKLTQADVYLDALRRRGIAYVIDGEKHFYRRQEVIDLVNVLRVLDNPHDHLALAGVLRSPVGALSDRDLYDLFRTRLLDYRYPERLVGWKHHRSTHVERLYRRLSSLRDEVPTRPLGILMEHIFATLPLLELAAASLHGEQAVLNLLKIRQIALTLAERPFMTFSRFVELMVSRLDRQPDEAESVLAEETPEAVRVMTVHKAKGLEFPIVILPGAHQGAGRSSQRPMVMFDWSSGSYGVSLGRRSTLGGVLLQERLAEREVAERRRVLYVGMTRAKDLLVFTGALTERTPGDSVIGLLETISGHSIGSNVDQILVGDSRLECTVQAAPSHKQPRRISEPEPGESELDMEVLARRWHRRTETWHHACATPWRLTPTDVLAAQAPFLRVRRQASWQRSSDSSLSRLVGICVHRVLQHWDYGAGVAAVPAAIRAAIESLPSLDRDTHGSQLVEPVTDLVSRFMASPSYARIRQAEILGREIPFLMSWEDDRIMEGVIDLVYRHNGRLWVADYKTDRVVAGEVLQHAERYRPQGEIYRRAVERACGRSPVWLEFIFLQAGRSLEYGPGSP